MFTTSALSYVRFLEEVKQTLCLSILFCEVDTAPIMSEKQQKNDSCHLELSDEVNA